MFEIAKNIMVVSLLYTLGGIQQSFPILISKMYKEKLCPASLIYQFDKGN